MSHFHSILHLFHGGFSRAMAGRAKPALPVIRPKWLQTGIRQRSLTGHCRLGRVTELVLLLVDGAVLVCRGAGRRTGLVAGMALAALALPDAALAMTFNVATEAELGAAISAVNDGEGNDTIVVTQDITLNGFLPAIDLPERSVTIDLGGNTVSGGGVTRIFFVNAGAVTIQNGTLADGVAQGGAGGDAAFGGGGGGMGAGGALFLRGDTGSVVLLSDVDFVDNAAKGGAGGSLMTGSGSGGGGGLGGSGGTGQTGVGDAVSAGGGGTFAGGDNATRFTAGAGGGPLGGAGGNIESPDGEDGGDLSGGGGGFQIGAGGAGGYGGGGGGSGNRVSSPGGAGGFGGGGGGGVADGGAGGFGGGGGGELSGPGAFGGYGGGYGFRTAGGGGAGFGGAVFVQEGASLVFFGGGMVTGGSVVGGAGGIYGSDQAASGQAAGSGIFLQNSVLALAPDRDRVITIEDMIADDADNGDSAGAIVVDGAGRVVLSGANTYAGDTEVWNGTLEIRHSDALGRPGEMDVTRVEDGATLAMSGGITTADTIVLSGDGVGGGGALRSLSGNNTVTRSVILNGAARINADAGRLTLFGIEGKAADLTLGGDDPSSVIEVMQPIDTGFGGLTKDGRNTAVLWAPNSFTGNVLLKGGGLRLASGEALADAAAVVVEGPATLFVDRSERIGSLAGAGAVVLGAGSDLTLGDETDQTFSGIVSHRGAAGGIRKEGSGTMTLAGVNSYGGATIVNGGTLRVTGAIASPSVTVNSGSLSVDGDAIAANAAITLNGGGNLTIDGGVEQIGALASGSTSSTVTLTHGLQTGANGASTGFAGTMRGAGGLTKQGAGTFTLTGANGFTGPTTVEGGVLALLQAGALASSEVRVLAGATLRTDGDALGAGATLSTAGTFTSTGRESFVAIDQTGGLIDGEGPLSAGRFGMSGGTMGSTLTARTGSALSGGTISGSLSGGGTGTVAVAGGTVQLSAGASISDVAGPVTITAGTLRMGQGSRIGDVAIGSGGLLGGTGLTGAVTVGAGGRIEAGNSIGTLVTGDVTFAPGSVLSVETDPANGARADLIAAGGAVTIAGGTVRHLGEAGIYDPSRSWQIITSARSVTGRFDTVTSDYTFLSPQLSYGPNAVTLTLARNAVPVTTVARTPNQRATANGLQAIEGAPISNAFVTLSGASATEALDQLSGEGLVAVSNGLLEEGRMLGGFVLRESGPQPAAAGGAGVTRSTSGAGGSGFWAQGYGEGETQRSSGYFDVGLTRTGLLAGQSWQMQSGWHLGAAAGLGKGTVDVSDLSTSADTVSKTLGLALGRSWGATTFELAVVGSSVDVDSERSVSIGGPAERLSASYGADVLTAMAQLGTTLDGARWSLSPFARLTYQHLSTEAHAETGGTSALTRSADRADHALVTVGASASRDVVLGAMPARLTGQIALQHSLTGSGSSALHVLAGSSPFAIASGAAGDTRVDVAVGLDVPLAENANLALRGAVTAGDGERTGLLGIDLSMRF